MKTFPKPLSAGEEKEYLERCKEGDQSARDMLIEHNMRLVAHVVKKYQGSDYDMEDLLSVGTIGLIKAVNTFNADKGSRLVDVIEMDNKETLDTMIFKQDVKELYEAFESCLTETEKTVLGMRYGLYRGKEHTQREIAGKLGISRSYVSRIEKKAIEKIRTEFAKHG